MDHVEIAQPTEPVTQPSDQVTPRRGILERIAKVMFVVLLVTASVYVVVGTIDFLGGKAIDARLLGALNLAAAAVWFATAFGFRYRTLVTLGLIVAGGSIAIAYGAYFLWQWSRYGGTDDRLAALALWMLTVGSVTLLILIGLWPTYGMTDRTMRRLGAGRFGIPVLAVIGTVGALFQFWYTAAYGPSALPPNLAIEAHLTPVSQLADSTVRAYSVDVEVKNVGTARVQVLASWFNVAVLRAGTPSAGGDYAATVDLAFKKQPWVLESQPHRAARVVTDEQPMIVASGELLERGWFFEPGEDTRIQFLTFADPGSGDVLHLGVGIDMARGSRLELGDAPPSYPCATDGPVVDVMDWSSTEPSAIRSFTAPQVHMVYAWERSDLGVIGLQTCYEVNKTWHPVPEAGQPPDPMLPIIEAEYGLTATSAEAQVSLWPDVTDQVVRAPATP